MTMTAYTLPEGATRQSRAEASKLLQDEIHTEDMTSGNVWGHITEFEKSRLDTPTEYGKKAIDYFDGKIPIGVAEVLNSLSKAVNNFIIWRTEKYEKSWRFPVYVQRRIVRLVATAITDIRALDKIFCK